MTLTGKVDFYTINGKEDLEDYYWEDGMGGYRTIDRINAFGKIDYRSVLEEEFETKKLITAEEFNKKLNDL